jgi:hypothetical protein
MARSVLDQKVGDADPLGYGMGKSAQSREMMSRLLCPIVFELVVGDLGAPRGIDKARVKELKRQRRNFLQFEEDIFQMLSRVSITASEERAEAHAQSGKAMPANIAQMSAGEVWKVAQERAAHLATTLEDVETRAESQRADLQRQARACDKELRANEIALREAETTEVPLPELEERGWVPQVQPYHQPEEEDDEIPDEDLDLTPAPLVPVRNVITLDEFVRVIGKSIAVVRRWLDPDYLEAPGRRVKGVPWTAHDLRQGRVLIQESERSRRINTDHINRTVLNTAQEQMLVVLLSQPEPPRRRR